MSPDEHVVHPIFQEKQSFVCGIESVAMDVMLPPPQMSPVAVHAKAEWSKQTKPIRRWSVGVLMRQRIHVVTSVADPSPTSSGSSAVREEAQPVLPDHLVQDLADVLLNLKRLEDGPAIPPHQEDTMA